MIGDYEFDREAVGEEELGESFETIDIAKRAIGLILTDKSKEREDVLEDLEELLQHVEHIKYNIQGDPEWATHRDSSAF